MTSGPLLLNMLRFSLPLMLSGVLQLLYNAADIVVVGRFAGSSAMAAVGSTSSLIALTTNLFMGLAVGACVTVAQFHGAQSHREVTDTVHTAIGLSLVCGFVAGALGWAAAGRLLALTGSPPDVIDQATQYLGIYFLGVPFSLVYNFAASILRAIGDTRRPLYYLSIAGAVNVLLNLLFVIRFGMGAGGVALATVISQCVSAALTLVSLMRSNGAIRLHPKRIRLSPDKVWLILKVGLPAGLQASIFSFSNVLIQSAVNSFGSVAMAGNAAAANIEGFVYTSMNAVHHTALTFTGQNAGAGRVDRIPRVLSLSILIVLTTGALLGFSGLLLDESLLRLYSTDTRVIAYGKIRLGLILKTYSLCGIMEALVGILRGMGNATLPMLVSFTGVVGVRILWLFTVFAKNRTPDILYLSYPISWAVTSAAHYAGYFLIMRKRARGT